MDKNIKFPIKLHGMVTHGKKLGRTMDIPTANIIPVEDISGLKFGVYYSSVEFDGKKYKSISNVGIKPTVKESTDVNVESFIYDYDGDIYDKEIEVTLYEFRRDEMKFSSMDELSSTMHNDLDAGRIYSYNKN